MGLLPLEFTDGLTDSPYFREILQAHERELDSTNVSIKHLIKDIKDLVVAARNLSRAQRTLSDTLNNFNFECIGNSQTDDEMVIANSFKDFGQLLSNIEDERDRLLAKADEAFLEPIERFRREQIGTAKEAKKKFDKETAKYCQNLERYLNLSARKNETQLWEADANNSMEQQHFFKAMSEYVLKLQEVNERKKFEFVETVLSFMLGWLTFYNQGHEIATDFYSVKMELQMRLQRTRNNFNMTQEQTQSLRQKMINNQEKFKQKYQDFDQVYTRQGYLFLKKKEKKAFTTSWVKHFCKYEKQFRRLTITQYHQTVGKVGSTEEIYVKECIKRSHDTIDRRFCFDIVTYPIEKSNANSNSGQNSAHHNHISIGPASKHANSSPNPSNSDHHHTYTLQALSEEDYKHWLIALEARDPSTNLNQTKSKDKHGSKSNVNNNFIDKALSGGESSSSYSNSNESYILDGEGYWFVKKCIGGIEFGGLDQKGMYRVVGVTSRVRAVMELFLNSKSKIKSEAMNNIDEQNLDAVDLLPNFVLKENEFETKTITSALKGYLRNLTEPIMTFDLHNAFISAAKLENRASRTEKIHQLLHQLPPINFKVLNILIEHLHKIANLSDKNLMTSSNLGVCFGPTLLRTSEESVAAILDIKFVNVIAELLIDNYERFFLTKPIMPNESNQQQQLKINNYFASQIQQRPLPNVPVSQTSQLIHGKMSVDNIRIMSSPPQSSLDLPGNNALNNNVRRSNSQDQLYSTLRCNPNLFPSNNVGNIYQQSNGIGPPMAPMLHPQHSKQSQYNLYYPLYPEYQQHLKSPSMTNPNVSRMALNLPVSSSSLSPSSSKISTIANQNINAKTYSNQIIYKQLPQSNSLYGQIQNTNYLMQPSISYQNLHYNNGDLIESNDGLKKNITYQSCSNVIHNRPMTSIGIIPPNSNYSPLNKPSDNDLTNKSDNGNVINKANYSNIGQTQQTGIFISQQQQPQQQSQLQSQSPGMLAIPATSGTRPINFSSSSSASLPSTPEHTQLSPYKSSPIVPVIKQAISVQQTQSVLNRQTSLESAISGLDPLNEMYSPNIFQAVSMKTAAQQQQHQQQQQQQQQMQQQQQIYESIGSASPQFSPSNNHLPSRTVRTRYVCIGGNETELSFQPNMIITNVRRSREPGWLEGNLNGKTGLIPQNYVEFID